MTSQRKTNRIIIRENIEAYSLAGSIADAIAYLERVKEELPSDVRDDAILEINYDGDEFEVCCYQQETDEEFSERTRREQFRKEIAQAELKARDEVKARYPDLK